MSITFIEGTKLIYYYFYKFFECSKKAINEKNLRLKKWVIIVMENKTLLRYNVNFVLNFEG